MRMCSCRQVDEYTVDCQGCAMHRKGEREMITAINLDGCQDSKCESFAHSEYFTHDAIMENSTVDLALGERSFDLCEYSYHELAYMYGLDTPNYPVPAIPLETEYVFGSGLADGVFVRQEGYIVAGAYRDGMPI